MTRYYEVSDSTGPKGRVVAELNRTQLTRLFKGAYRIYVPNNNSKPIAKCDTVRFIVTPPNGELLARFDLSDGACWEVPLKIKTYGGVPRCLEGVDCNHDELAVFVLPPARTTSGRSCARVWLALYRSGSDTDRPAQYTYVERDDPGIGDVISPCSDSVLSSLEICKRGVDGPVIAQDDEAEGYHED